MDQVLGALGFETTETKAAAISGALTLAGVLATGLGAIGAYLLTQATERRDAQARWDEKRGDLLRALWSDILPVWQVLELEPDLDDRLRDVEAIFAAAEAAGEGYTPFVMPVAGSLFSGSLTDDFVYLTTHEIEIVVGYYHQIGMLNRMVQDMQAPAYAAMAPASKRAMLADLIKMEDGARRLAYLALTTLEPAIDPAPRMGVAARLAELRGRVSRTGAVPSHPAVEGPG